MFNRYFLVLLVGIFALIGGILILLKLTNKNNKNVINTYFCILISIFYFFNVLISTFPLNRSNLHMVTPISNMSPFLFSMTFVCIFLNEERRKPLLKFMSLFNAVMIVAGFVSTIYGIIIGSYYFDFIIFDELAHIFFGLFMFFLIKTKQVKITKNDLIKSYIIIWGILLLVFGINFIFGTRFFGLCLNDQYNIYGLKIFGNYHISNLVYVLALFLIVFIGYVINNSLYKKRQKQ